MEIPDMDIISNFEAGMNCLQNPSFISRLFSFPGAENVFQVYSFWKYGALIFAIYATFSSLIRRIKLVFFSFHTIKPSLVENKQIVFSEDDEISLGSSDDEREEEKEEEEENSPTTSFRGRLRVDEDFCVKSSCWSQLRQRRRRISGGETFDWSDFTSGKSVVKLWDSLSSSFNFGEAFSNFGSNDVVSLWNFDDYRKSNGFSDLISNFPEVVFTAEGNGNGDGVVLRGYDARVRRRVPSLYAEWRSPAPARISRIASGDVGKVYVKRKGALTVGDVRNVKMPLETGGDSDGETWWDADAVIVEDEFLMVDNSS